jgi:hypothetical protein
VYLNGSGTYLDSTVIMTNLTQLDFGRVLIDSSKDSIVVLTNTTKEKLILNSFSLNDSVFKVSSFPALPLSILAGESETIMLSFFPDDTIKYFDTLSIGAKDVFGNKEVYLAGSGALLGLDNIESHNLYNNYPNPFNSVTNIRYDVKESIKVKLIVYNILGQRVRVFVDEIKKPGSYLEKWDSQNENGVYQPSGIYFIQMTAGSFRKVRKIMLIR